MIRKSKKFKAPQWFQKAYKEAEEKEKDLFEYFSEVVGYGPEWCKQHIDRCLEKLESRERPRIISELSKLDVINKYIWSRFFYENWDKIKNLAGVKPPEYNSKKKTIRFQKITIFEKVKKSFNL